MRDPGRRSVCLPSPCARELCGLDQSRDSRVRDERIERRRTRRRRPLRPVSVVSWLLLGITGNQGSEVLAMGHLSTVRRGGRWDPTNIACRDRVSPPRRLPEIRKAAPGRCRIRPRQRRFPDAMAARCICCAGRKRRAEIPRAHSGRAATPRVTKAETRDQTAGHGRRPDERGRNHLRWPGKPPMMFAVVTRIPQPIEKRSAGLRQRPMTGQSFRRAGRGIAIALSAER